MSVAVGICSAVEDVRWGAWNQTVAMVPRSYATAVQRSGALAFVLPPDDHAAEAPDALLDRIDALILAGGADIDPASYGAKPHPETGPTWPERDRFELGMTHRALERDIPVLGICRGMQMVNVACGGTLAQHLPDAVGHSDHRQMPGTFGDHDVRLEAGSLAARAAGTERLTVKSHHHQGADEIGEDLIATGWAARREGASGTTARKDGVVEAIELPQKRFALGVLWHPEEDMRDRVIEALVNAAKPEVGDPGSR